MKLSRKEQFDEREEPIDNEPLEPDEEGEYQEDDDYGYDDDFYEEGRPPMDKHSDLLKGLTNFEKYITELTNGWMGIVFNPISEKYERDKDIKPIMNRKGAMWCSTYIRTYARENNIITDISREEFGNMIGDIIEAIWLNLGTREDLGIKTDGDLIRVCNEIEHSAALCLMGAGDGKYKGFLGTTVSRHETINPDGTNISPERGYQTRSSGGIMGKMKRMLIGR